MSLHSLRTPVAGPPWFQTPVIKKSACEFVWGPGSRPQARLYTHRRWPASPGLSREELWGAASKPALGPCSWPGSGCCPGGSRAGRGAGEAPSPEPTTLERANIALSPRVPGRRCGRDAGWDASWVSRWRFGRAGAAVLTAWVSISRCRRQPRLPRRTSPFRRRWGALWP